MLGRQALELKIYSQLWDKSSIMIFLGIRSFTVDKFFPDNLICLTSSFQAVSKSLVLPLLLNPSSLDRWGLCPQLPQDSFILSHVDVDTIFEFFAAVQPCFFSRLNSISLSNISSQVTVLNSDNTSTTSFSVKPRSSDRSVQFHVASQFKFVDRSLVIKSYALARSL